MKHIITQEFLRIEAIGTQVGQAQINSRGGGRDQRADPVALQVVLTPDADHARVIDAVTLVDHRDRLYRVVTGVWCYVVPTELLSLGVAYTARFRYEMTAGDLNVVRQSFVWNAVPTPRNGGCVVHGTLTDIQGLPVANEKLVVEQYRDMVTLNQRTLQQTVASDPFGVWWLELPYGTVARVVFGDVAKVIKVPPKAEAALKDIPAFQPAAARTDSLGYPMP